MSRTEEDISSRVDITIMRHSTLRTYPTSYSEFCDTFRPRLASARRTDSGRERFIDFLVPSPVRKRFVAEHVSEGRPACIGQAASMAAVLLAAGAKGKRFSLPNSRIVIHQPLMSGLGGQATDIDIAAREILRMRERINDILVHHTGQTVKRIQDDRS